jgi:hypothetical protein
MQWYQISGVSKRTDTKEGTQFRVIMEQEEKKNFCFRPFVNGQEFLELNYLPETL